MNDILHHRRHRFDALFALLTGRDIAPVPQTPQLLRDIGVAEPLTPVVPSCMTPLALAIRAGFQMTREDTP